MTSPRFAPLIGCLWLVAGDSGRFARRVPLSVQAELGTPALGSAALVRRAPGTPAGGEAATRALGLAVAGRERGPGSPPGRAGRRRNTPSCAPAIRRQPQPTAPTASVAPLGASARKEQSFGPGIRHFTSSLCSSARATWSSHCLLLPRGITGRLTPASVLHRFIKRMKSGRIS